MRDIEEQGFDLDLILEPRNSERRAWVVAGVAVAVALLLCIVLVLLMPLKQTEVFTVLVDRQTGDAERIVQVEPTGIQDEEAVKEALLVAYITDRESFIAAGIQQRLESVQRRSAENAEITLRNLWTDKSDNADYPPRVYGAGSEVYVTVKTITFLEPLVAQVRFEKTLRRPRQAAVSRPFVATIGFNFEPKRERSLQRVWENPLGFLVSTYRVDAETIGGN